MEDMGERFCFFVLFCSHDEMWVPEIWVKGFDESQDGEVNDCEKFSLGRSLNLVVS